MKRKIKVPKERNPVAAYAKHSGSGAHGKTKKALRKGAKQNLRNLDNDLDP